jgi:hypothetical protein
VRLLWVITYLTHIRQKELALTSEQYISAMEEAAKRTPAGKHEPGPAQIDS